MPKIQQLKVIFISLVEVTLLKEVGVAVTIALFLKWISQINFLRKQQLQERKLRFSWKASEI